MRRHTGTHNYLQTHVIMKTFLLKFSSQNVTAGPALNKNQTTEPHHVVTLRMTFEIHNNTLATWVCFMVTT